MLGPRIVIAGTASGVGKTTVAAGLMAALRARGVQVASAKVGPDFIDPGYHALATGRPGRNLDSWICGEDAIGPLAGRASRGAEVLVVEGVMGLFDGSSDNDGPDASTASIARLLAAPVVLVVDASAMSRSVAAMVSGYTSFEPGVQVAGVVLNRVGSPGHAALLREALAPLGIPVLGALARDDAFTWRDRHLGLVPVAEERRAVAAALERLAGSIAPALDLEAVMAIARACPPLRVADAASPRPTARAASRRARVAVAGGPAFSFVYRDNLEALEAAGAELVAFDPLRDATVPAGTDALYLGGGFPEVYAAALSANTSLLADVRAHVAAGTPTWAECGGLLWLARRLDGARLAGIVPAEARMTERLTLGYRTATARRTNPLVAPGAVLRGHEFHYSALDPPGDALILQGSRGTSVAGFATPTLFASYVHVHLGGDPSPAAAFVARAADARPEEHKAQVR